MVIIRRTLQNLITEEIQYKLVFGSAGIIITMDIDYTRSRPHNVNQQINLAHYLTKKLATRNKQLKLLAGCVRQFDQIFSSQEYIVQQLANQLSHYKEGRSKEIDAPNSPFKETDFKIQKLKQRGVRKSSKIIPQRPGREAMRSHNKSKTLEDDKNFKFPKLTPQKRPALDMEEEPNYGYKEHSPFSENKIVKIPIHRLVPVSYEDIRRRIESKLA